jgi:hypothetical protein
METSGSVAVIIGSSRRKVSSSKVVFTSALDLTSFFVLDSSKVLFNFTHSPVQ